MPLISFEEARARALGLAKGLETEVVSVEAAIGRVLGPAVLASRTLPPWDNAAMDGYAVAAADVPRAGMVLPLVGQAAAGGVPLAVSPGTCARIFTGAPLPRGADTVVMQERTTATAAGIEFHDAPRPGQHLRRRGEDVERGVVLLDAGAVVGVGEAAAAWAQGLTRLEVVRRPTVAIASSGDELRPVGTGDDQAIIDTNSPAIAALVTRAGGVATCLGIAPDRPDAVEALFRKGLGHDVLITLAGASVGDHDYTRPALARLGFEPAFSKVAIKPGKPVSAGRCGSALVFSLPGNPVSALVTFELFVRPVLRSLQGLAQSPAQTGRLDGELSKPEGLRHFVRARASLVDGQLVATPLSAQSSGAFTSLKGATHLISIGPSVTTVTAGEPVELIPLVWGA